MDKSVQLLSVQQMNLLDVLLRIPIWDESSYQDHQLVQMTSPSSHCTTCLIGNPQLLQNHHSWTKIEINLYFVINYNLHVIIMCYIIIKKIFKNREDTVKNKFPPIGVPIHLWPWVSYYEFSYKSLANTYNSNVIKQKKYFSLNKKIYKTTNIKHKNSMM